MARLAVLLALCQITLIHGLPAREARREQGALEERAVTISTNIDVTTSYRSPVSTLQSASVTADPTATGSILTGLPSGGFTGDPLKTSNLPDPTGSIAPIDSSLAPGPTQVLNNVAENIFVPIATNAPPQEVKSRDDHVVKKLNIVDQDVPIETNKFYANFFLGGQNQPVWTHPYSLAWAKGVDETYGMSVSHIERSQLAWDDANDPPRYFIGPIGIRHIVLSAKELGKDTVLSTEQLTAFSVYANLAPDSTSKPIISFPCVQGMGYVTGIYNQAQPQLNSGVQFRTLKYAGELNGVTYKYQIQLEDDSQWLLYVTPVASLGVPPFTLNSSTLIEGPKDFIGMLQVAKNPASTAGELIYDSTAGAYAVNTTISGSVNGGSGTYTLKWNKDGVRDQTLLMFLLPHHVESLSQPMGSSALTDIELVTVTKGTSRAIVADDVTFLEQNLPDTISFGPWIPNADGSNGGSDNSNLNDIARALVQSSGATELSQDMSKQTSLNSMYYSGKGLAKFAGIILTMQTMAKDTQRAAAGLVQLKDCFNVFVNNTQPLPLVYDTVWKGVVSSGTYENGDTGLDFGNTLYNDHHFHYGYFVYTAAVIGYLDPAWLEQGSNKAWVNMLVRDFANPSASDPYFPFQRSFDWINGHSWAKGLFDSGDGKDQESSSEDTFATYGLKMWGKISGDANMEARANLQLAVQARSLRNYFLLQSDNKVQPERFIPNKVTGILFENKIDHTTYFGANPEFIQGIHMIPINPASAYTRSKKFVQEEWDTYFSQGRVDSVDGGWRGVLYSNLILTDPQTAYNFFADENFDAGYLDGGASRTWYLAYAAAMMGSQPAGANATKATIAPVQEAKAPQTKTKPIQVPAEEAEEPTEEEEEEEEDSAEEAEEPVEEEDWSGWTSEGSELSDVESRDSDTEWDSWGEYYPDGNDEVPNTANSAAKDDAAWERRM